MRKIEEGDADIVALDAGDVYEAGKWVTSGFALVQAGVCIVCIVLQISPTQVLQPGTDCQRELWRHRQLLLRGGCVEANWVPPHPIQPDSEELVPWQHGLCVRLDLSGAVANRDGPNLTHSVRRHQESRWVGGCCAALWHAVRVYNDCNNSQASCTGGAAFPVSLTASITGMARTRSTYARTVLLVAWTSVNVTHASCTTAIAAPSDVSSSVSELGGLSW